MVKLLRIGLCFLGVVGTIVGHAFEQDAEDEFAIKREHEMNKIEDFYTRLNDIDRMDAERRSGEAEMRKYRKEVATENEAARQEYVRLRKAKPHEDPTAWEQELIERKREYEKSRKSFVQRRDEMNRALKSVGKIPEDDEYDIDEYSGD